MSMATLHAAPEQKSLRLGDRRPVLQGQFLSGADTEVQQASYCLGPGPLSLTEEASAAIHENFLPGSAQP